MQISKWCFCLFSPPLESIIEYHHFQITEEDHFELLMTCSDYLVVLVIGRSLLLVLHDLGLIFSMVGALYESVKNGGSIHYVLCYKRVMRQAQGY